MKWLVFSDSHGNIDYMRRAIELEKPDRVLHLGDVAWDGARLLDACPGLKLEQVRGNCDWASQLPTVGEYEAEGVRIFYTHGHLYGVKSGDYQLISAARERKAQVALFGHTHLAREDYEDGLYLMNPGRLSGWEASYGILDITPQGIVTNVVRLGGL